MNLRLKNVNPLWIFTVMTLMEKAGGGLASGV
jgi:hypothetical protein